MKSVSCWRIVSSTALLAALAIACVGESSVPTDAGVEHAPRDAGASVDAGYVDDGGVPVVPPPEPPVACGARLTGAEPAMTTEFTPDYAAEASALNLDETPPPFDTSAEDGLRATLVNYMLGRRGGTIVSSDDLMGAGPAGEALWAAFAIGEGELDFTFLRRGFHYSYYCSRPVPFTLADLIERYGDYKTWPLTDVPCGAPKDGPRRLYAEPEGRAYVAETVDGEGVRETEVLFKDLRDDGQLDFAVYTDEGKLSDRSEFATASSSIVLAAPYTCITCHFDFERGTIDEISPTGTGAGCN